MCNDTVHEFHARGAELYPRIRCGSFNQYEFSAMARNHRRPKYYFLGHAVSVKRSAFFALEYTLPLGL